MLTELRIANLAIIEEQAISFGAGLNVITGETGAGKSMVLQALELILGARPNAHLVRDGAEALEVEAAFSLADLTPAVREQLPEIAQGDELVLSRSVGRAGRSKVLMNGRLATVTLLEEVCARVVNICGQNQNVRLLDPAYHLELLDGYIGHQELLATYRAAYDGWRAAVTELETVRAKSAESEAHRGAAEEALKELEAIELRPGIRAELEGAVKKLGASEALIERGSILLESLHGEDGVTQRMHQVVAQLSELARLDDGMRDLLARTEGTRRDFGEIERDLSRYLRSVTTDEESLQRKRDHLAEVARLERKYKCTDAALVALRDQYRSQLGVGGSEADLKRLAAEVEKQLREVEKLAHRLTEARSRAAGKLAKDAAGELADLAMADCRLELTCEQGELGVKGRDRVQFLAATNKGSALRPLKQIASGGELSRITLVLKKLLRDKSGVNVLVFDEVDTGISGKVARSVGEKLRELAEQSQVICITHLPQVASLAHHHFLVEKGGKTRTSASIRELSKNDRVDEIARMLAGYEVTPASRASARELLSSNLRD